MIRFMDSQNDYIEIEDVNDNTLLCISMGGDTFKEVSTVCLDVKRAVIFSREIRKAIAEIKNNQQ